MVDVLKAGEFAVNASEAPQRVVSGHLGHQPADDPHETTNDEHASHLILRAPRHSPILPRTAKLSARDTVSIPQAGSRIRRRRS